MSLNGIGPVCENLAKLSPDEAREVNRILCEYHRDRAWRAAFAGWMIPLALIVFLFLMLVAF
jgi:hypothetical protein